MDISAASVLGKGGGVADAERVGSVDLDGELVAVDALHALDLGECDDHVVLEAVSLLVERGHDALRVIVDGRYHGAQRLLAVRVDDLELVAKVAEYLAENAARLGHNQLDAVLMAVGAELELLGRRALRQHDHLEAGQVGAREPASARRLEYAHGHVDVELGEVRLSARRTILADVRLGGEVVRGEVVVGDRLRVLDGHRLDAAENDILGDLEAQAAHAAHEHVGRLHLAHGLVAEHVQLTRVQTLVDVVAVAAAAVAVGVGVGRRWHLIAVARR